MSMVSAMEAREFSIPEESAGRRLDLVVQELLGPEHSRAQVQRLIKDGAVTLDGGPARAAHKVAGGEAVRVSLPPPEPSELEPQDMSLKVLYEDEHLIVVNKDPGVVVHPSPGHSQGTLVHGLLAHCGDLAGIGGELRPGIVHRLDKDTSGALVAAKHDQAHRRLVAAFAAGRVHKRYLALVYGKPPLTDVIEAGIGRHPTDRKRFSSRGSRTKPAKTSWRMLLRRPQDLSLLSVTIATGRTHQIRVHLSEAGWPVVGDPLYGGRRGRRKLAGDAGLAVEQAGRQLLHALELSFDHPMSGRRIAVLAPLPADFRRVLAALARQAGQEANHA